MPISLPSLKGLVPYKVEEVLRSITAVIGDLEAQVEAVARVTAPAADPDARAGVQLTEQQVQVLLRKVRDLEARVTALENP